MNLKTTEMEKREWHPVKSYLDFVLEQLSDLEEDHLPGHDGRVHYLLPGEDRRRYLR